MTKYKKNEMTWHQFYQLICCHCLFNCLLSSPGAFDSCFYGPGYKPVDDIL